MSDVHGFNAWCVVELRDRTRIGARVRDAVIAGHGFLRLDIYSGRESKPVPDYIRPDTVVRITPASESVCRALAATEQPPREFATGQPSRRRRVRELQYEELP